MWDNARLLNMTADALFVAAAAMVVWLAAQTAVRSPLFPVRGVVVVGDADRVDAESIAAQLDGRIAGNFFGIDLADARTRIEGAPGVRRATVRRTWPDRLVAEIEAHRPLARWPDGRLVNTYGELFEGETDQALPRLRGPNGTEREVARRYLAARAVLAPLGIEPVEVTLSGRFAWQMRLANGVVIELGRDDARESLDARLARFAAAYPRIVDDLKGRLEYVDLRYASGFAIRVAGEPAERAGNNSARKRS